MKNAINYCRAIYWTKCNDRTSFSHQINSNSRCLLLGHVWRAWCRSNRYVSIHLTVAYCGRRLRLKILPRVHCKSSYWLMDPTRPQLVWLSTIAHIINLSLYQTIRNISRWFRFAARTNQCIFQWGHWRTLRPPSNPHGFRTRNHGFRSSWTFWPIVPPR